MFASLTYAESKHKLIGNQLVIGINHYPIEQSWLKFIKDNEISGVIFISDAYRNADHVKNTIIKIKKVINHKMFFCIDQEGGKVNRIKENIIQVPAASIIAKTHTEKEAFQLYQKQAHELSAIGINVNFSPVLDIIDNDKNNVIGNRSFGNNYKVVFNYGKQVINASLMENVLPVIKHFPGHGYTYTDSHHVMPVHNNVIRLIKQDVIPFKKSIKLGSPAIMIAHILYPKLDKVYPASLSKEIVTNYLKNSLKFNGIIFSDDISMGAIKQHYSLTKAIQTSIEAGIHQVIVITSLEKLKEILNTIEIELTENRVLEQILKKNKLKLLQFK